MARTEKDMTQKALAEAVGISRQTMNAIEQGEFNPTIRLCRAICRALGKTLDDVEEPGEGAVLYCLGCQLSFTGEEKCPSCGNKRIREIRPEDICFLTEIRPIPATILQDLLKQEEIPVLTGSTVGAGMAMKAGNLFERIKFFVRYEHLEKAAELAKEILAAPEEE